MNGLLFGDVLAIGRADLALIWAATLLGLAVLCLLWRPLVASSSHSDLAQAEGVAVGRYRLLQALMLAAVVALGIRIVGALLITALLILPAAAARPFSHSPERMAFVAALVAALSVLAGLTASLQFDTLAGPSIVVAALLMFSLAMTFRGRR